MEGSRPHAWMQLPREREPITDVSNRRVRALLPPSWWNNQKQRKYSIKI